MPTVKPYIDVCRKCRHLSLRTITHGTDFNPATLRFRDRCYQHYFRCDLITNHVADGHHIGEVGYAPSVPPHEGFIQPHAGNMAVPESCPYHLEQTFMNDQHRGTTADLDQMKRFAADACLLRHPSIDDARIA